MNVLFAGPDSGLVAALEAAGATVTRIDGMVTAARLDDAGVADADLFVLTDAGEATAIPVAVERNPDLRVIAYTGDSLPEFAVAGLDIALDPALYDPELVAEELVG